MSRQEIPVDVWREKVLAKSNHAGDTTVATVVPDLDIVDTDFRVLPDTVFEFCTGFVVNLYGQAADRDIFSLFYRSKLDENQAAMVNRRIHSAEADRKRVRESSNISPEQEVNFDREIEGNTDKLLMLRVKVTMSQGTIKDKITNHPESGDSLKECESAYNNLLLLAVQPDEEGQSLDLLRATDLIHELIGLNIREHSLPPIK